MATMSQALTGTGATAAAFIKDGVVRLSGTFSGTCQVEIDVLGDGVYSAADDSTGAALNLTTVGTMRVNNGVACNTRVNCTAYTSGTINVAIRGER